MLGGPTPTRPRPSRYDRAVDAATRWETEALRTGRRPSVSQKRGSDERRWVTLREAADATGVPVGTIRSWSKTDAVDTYLELDGESALRMVDLDGVRMRARDLGRSPVEHDHPVAGLTAAGYEEELQTMIVPIDAWNKMLMQLGNLHEAGQQLAEARERAARAETETLFLREQLKELRARRQEAEPLVDEGPEPTTQTPPSTPEAEPTSSRVSFLRYVYRGWRSRR